MTAKNKNNNNTIFGMAAVALVGLMLGSVGHISPVKGEKHSMEILFYLQVQMHDRT